MFRIRNPAGSGFLTTDQCDDASPQFIEVPAVQICRGYKFTFNHNAVDINLDSLVYSFDQPVSNNFAPIGWAAGYSTNNPLPDQNFHTSNIPSTLDPLTGEMTQAIYNGSGQVSYVTCIKVDTYRAGEKVASIWRDIPFIMFTCPPIPGTGKKNSAPLVTIDGDSAVTYNLSLIHI